MQSILYHRPSHTHSKILSLIDQFPDVCNEFHMFRHSCVSFCLVEYKLFQASSESIVLLMLSFRLFGYPAKPPLILTHQLVQEKFTISFLFDLRCYRLPHSYKKNSLDRFKRIFFTVNQQWFEQWLGAAMNSWRRYDMETLSTLQSVC